MKQSLFYKLFAQAFCLLAVLLFMFPLGLMVQKSLAGKGLQNYARVFALVDILPNFRTSLVVVLGTLVFVSIVTSFAAFAFSKIPFAGSGALYYLLLAGMMIPTSAILYPLFQIVRGLHLNNTAFSLVFPYVTLNAVFNLMVLKNYFDTLPDEMMEAATIDGANLWQIYRHVMLPISIPGMSIVLIQTFLSAWNELQMAMTFLNDPAVQPISVVPLRFVQTAGASFPLEVMYASLVICLLPIALFYLCAQKLLIQGLTAGAVKG